MRVSFEKAAREAISFKKNPSKLATLKGLRKEYRGRRRAERACKKIRKSLKRSAIPLPILLPAIRGDQKTLYDLLSEHVNHVSWQDQPSAIRNNPQEEQRRPGIMPDILEPYNHYSLAQIPDDPFMAPSSRERGFFYLKKKKDLPENTSFNQYNTVLVKVKNEVLYPNNTTHTAISPSTVRLSPNAFNRPRTSLRGAPRP